VAPLRRPDLLAGETFPPPPRQERSRRKRDALLESAIELFGERGYEETTIEEIARRAGVAVGGFYQHFASKRQILLVLMDRLLDEASALTSQAEQVDLRRMRDAIAELVRGGLQVDWAYAGAYRAWREAAARDGELRHLNRRIEEWTAEQLALILRQLQRAPGARPGVDTVTLAWVLGLLFWRLAEVPLEEPDPVIAGVTNMIYHSLYADDAGADATR
jgi:AcrR family transcriptional regulator